MLVKEIHDTWGKENCIYTYLYMCIYIYCIYILKQNIRSFPQRFNMSHSGRPLETVSCLSCFKQKNMEVQYLYSFFIQRNQTMEAAPSNM